MLTRQRQEILQVNNKVNAALLAISKPVAPRRRSTKGDASALKGSDSDCIHLVSTCADFHSPVKFEGKVGI